MSHDLIILSFFVVVIIPFLIWALNKLKQSFKKRQKHWHESFVKALLPPLIFTLLFFSLILAINIVREDFFALPVFQNSGTWLKIGTIFGVIWFLTRWKMGVMKILFKKSKAHEISWDTGKLDVINKVGTVALIFLSFLTLLEATHSNLTTLIAFGGIGGLALAFASQEIIANFFSGAMIYLTQPFLVGDLIQVPEKNIEGKVEEIGWYMTRIRTPDKCPVYIPNSIFSKIIVITPSRMTHRQFKETLSLRHQDMPKISSLIADIKNMLANHPQIDQHQIINVYLNNFGTYSLDIIFSAYTKTTLAEAFYLLREELLLKIYELMEKHGVKFAVPVTYFEKV